MKKTKKELKVGPTGQYIFLKNHEAYLPSDCIIKDIGDNFYLDGKVIKLPKHSGFIELRKNKIVAFMYMKGKIQNIILESISTTNVRMIEVEMNNNIIILNENGNEYRIVDKEIKEKRFNDNLYQNYNKIVRDIKNFLNKKSNKDYEEFLLKLNSTYTTNFSKSEELIILLEWFNTFGKLQLLK